MRKRNLLLAVGTVGILVLGLLYAAHIPQRLVDEVLYDNYNHYLPCERLPQKVEIEQALVEHAIIVDQIRSVSTGVNIQIDEMLCSGTARADLVISYPGHTQRVEIERLLGGKTFFGLPVRWRNW